ncbi:hypothetical protein KC622_00790 [Candidatus Dojkabacteria bacterium]|uniref:Uncharacterized protein n=1 Tax=Candidatus Dojkabacteria bacterium TaxID=2099670 RepID=A0A955HZ64_9BACT|nr:hypothetical protein [Candidatus Dojkabacteria bacterium]MCB9791059.1 hypothetical protein [Candidatus Nomurabacteria bacterium]
MEKSASNVRHETRLKSVTLVALGAFLFFFYFTYSGFIGVVAELKGETYSSQQSEVKGVETSITAELTRNSFKATPAGEGFDNLYLTLESPKQVAGVELNLRITGRLEVYSFSCSQYFRCIDQKISDGYLEVSAVRDPDHASQSLNGSVILGEIKYNPSTSGDLMFSSSGEKPSAIYVVGSSDSILTPGFRYLGIGSN